MVLKNGGKSTYYTKKTHTETLVFGSKEIGLEVNANVTKYVVMSRDLNAGRSHNIKIDNSSLERVEEFKYLGKPVTKILFGKKLRAD
jgi:hypothetical protein